MGLISSKPGSGSIGGIGFVGDGVADFRVGHGLAVGHQEADFAGAQLVHFHRLGGENAEGFDLQHAPIPHQADFLSLADGAFEDAGQHDHAAVGIKPGVENQRLQPVVRIAFGRRHAFDDGFQNIRHALASLGADQYGVGGVEPDRAFDHFLGALHIGAGQINLVDDGNDFEPVVDGEIGIGQGLRLYALRGVHHQQRAFAGGQRTRDLVGKINMARRVDQVELVGVPVLRGVHHADGVRLDGDAALPLQVHGVEYLGLHLARGERSGQLQQAVSQRGFAMIDMGNDGKIAEKGGVHGCSGQSLILTGRMAGVGPRASDFTGLRIVCFAEV